MAKTSIRNGTQTAKREITMMKIFSKAVSIFLVFVMVYGFYTLVKIRTLNVYFILTLNDMFAVCGFLLFINYSHALGLIITIICFLIIVLIGVFFLPEVLLRFSTIFRLIVIIFMIHQIVFYDKRHRKHTDGSIE
jgi:hypothetical protein